MARDSSPFSQRLKALAVRAGLPVDAGASPTGGTSGPTSTPDDERPTGEFAAVAPTDTPADDRPTGEFPAVTEVPPIEASAAGVPVEVPAPSGAESPAAPETESGIAAERVAEPDLSTELPPIPAPVWEIREPAPPAPMPPPVRDDAVAPPAPPAPIWTDSPPETQRPPATDEPTTSGPTLSPPTLSKSAELHEALTLPDEPSETPPSAAEPEVQPIQSPDVEVPEAPTSVFPSVTVLHDVATDVSPSPDEPATPQPTTQAGPSDADEPDEAPDLGEPSEPASPRERLSLTGRFAALRRRVTSPDSTPVDERDAPEPATATADPVAAAPAPEPTPAPQPVPVVEPQTSAKPSFSERAALRRRAKTLRARRDTGLLELGAIVLDQRRFGDPTAGALLRRRTDELGDLDNEIAAIEHALDDHASAAAVAALGAIRCVSCSALVGPSDRFCAHCGTPRPAGGEPAPASPADPTS